MTRTEALTHAIQEINRHWHCSGRSPLKHQPTLDILLTMRTEEHRKAARQIEYLRIRSDDDDERAT